MWVRRIGRQHIGCLTLPRTVCLLSSQGHAAVVVMKNLHSKLENGTGTCNTHAAC